MKVNSERMARLAVASIEKAKLICTETGGKRCSLPAAA